MCLTDSVFQYKVVLAYEHLYLAVHKATAKGLRSVEYLVEDTETLHDCSALKSVLRQPPSGLRASEQSEMLRLAEYLGQAWAVQYRASQTLWAYDEAKRTLDSKHVCRI